jgi:hypothetical protein
MTKPRVGFRNFAKSTKTGRLITNNVNFYQQGIKLFYFGRTNGAVVVGNTWNNRWVGSTVVFGVLFLSRA